MSGFLISALFDAIIGQCLSVTSKFISTYVGDSSIEELLQKAFVKACGRYSPNKSIAKYEETCHSIMIIDSFKNELASGVTDPKLQSSNKQLLSLFKEEIEKDNELLNWVKANEYKYSLGILNKIKDELGVIAKSIDENNKLQRQIISTLNSGFENKISIVFDDKSLSFSSIKPTFSFRKDLVSQLCSLILEGNILVLYGQKLIGKSVLSSLIASKEQFKGYSVKNISLLYLNNINIINILKEIVKNEDKNLIVLDGLDVSHRAEYVNELFEYIVSINSKSKRFIVCANNQYNTSLVNFLSDSINNYKVPLLTKNETEEILLNYGCKDSKIIELIYSFSGGFPVLVNILCEDLKSTGWSNAANVAMTLFSHKYSGEFSDKISSIVNDSIQSDEAKELLSRLLLVGNKFDNDIIDVLANVLPPINRFKDCLAMLIPQWVTRSDGGLYTISVLLDKVWQPGCIKSVRINCYSAIADYLLSKKYVNIDVAVQCVTYLLNAERYNDAGTVFIKCIEVYYQNKDIMKGSIIPAIWIDLALPVEMDLHIRVHIRFLQLVYLDLDVIRNNFLLQDLLKLTLEITNSLPIKKMSLLFISTRYMLNNDYDKAQIWNQKANDISIDINDPFIKSISEESKELLFETPLEELDYYLTKITNTEQLKQWNKMCDNLGVTKKEKYSNSSYHISACCVFTSNVLYGKLGKYGDNPPDWKEIVAYFTELLNCCGDGMEHALRMSLLCEIIKISGRYNNDLNYSIILYKQYVDNVSNVYQRLILNNALSSAYYFNGQYKDAIDILDEIISLASPNGLPYAYLSALQRLSFSYYHDNRLDDALVSIKKTRFILNSNPSLTSPTIVNSLGELSILLWEKDDKREAISCLCDATELAFKMYELDAESVMHKTLLSKLSVCSYTWDMNVTGHIVDSSKMLPFPGLFIDSICKDFYDEFNDDKLFAILYETYHLTSMFLDEEKSLKWAYLLIKYLKSCKDISRLAPICYSLIPLLISKKDFESIEYITMISKYSIDRANDSNPKMNFDSDGYYLNLCIIPFFLRARTEMLEENGCDKYYFSCISKSLEKYSCFLDNKSLSEDVASICTIDDKKDLCNENCLRNKNNDSIRILFCIANTFTSNPNNNFMCLLELSKYLRDLYYTAYGENDYGLLYNFIFAVFKANVKTHPNSFMKLDFLKTKGLSQLSNLHTNKEKIMFTLRLFYHHLIQPPDLRMDDDTWLFY